MKNDLFETAHIRLECPYRLNQKNWKPTFIPFAKAEKGLKDFFAKTLDYVRFYRGGKFVTIIVSIISRLSILYALNDREVIV